MSTKYPGNQSQPGLTSISLCLCFYTLKPPIQSASSFTNVHTTLMHFACKLLKWYVTVLQTTLEIIQPLNTVSAVSFYTTNYKFRPTKNQKQSNVNTIRSLFIIFLTKPSNVLKIAAVKAIIPHVKEIGCKLNCVLCSTGHYIVASAKYYREEKLELLPPDLYRDLNLFLNWPPQDLMHQGRLLSDTSKPDLSVPVIIWNLGMNF